MPEKALKTTLPTSFTFSQSSLQDYHDCARRFQLRYIEKLQWPAVETAPVMENERRQAEGQQFHRLVQQTLIGLPIEKMARFVENSGSADLERWWGHFISARSASLAELEDAALYPEHSLSVPIGKHRAVAKYDLIAVKNGKVTIYDWKTNHKRPKNEWMAARLQTRIYQSLLVHAGTHLYNKQTIEAEQVSMIYWYADFPDEPSIFEYDRVKCENDWTDLGKLISEISARQSFPLTEDDRKCGFCQFRSFCERGVAASNGDEMEVSNEFDWEANMEQIQEIEF